jgi:hypothetical protein
LFIIYSKENERKNTQIKEKRKETNKKREDRRKENLLSSVLLMTTGNWVRSSTVKEYPVICKAGIIVDV